MVWLNFINVARVQRYFEKKRSKSVRFLRFGVFISSPNRDQKLAYLTLPLRIPWAHHTKCTIIKIWLGGASNSTLLSSRICPVRKSYASCDKERWRLLRNTPSDYEVHDANVVRMRLTAIGLLYIVR